jgi:RNA polymerase sigma-70 factor, ECF subfamily
MTAQPGATCRHTFAHRLAALRPTLLRRARMLVGQADSEDLVQDAIERALRARDQYQDENLLAWVGRIMINRRFDDLRRQKRLARVKAQIDQPTVTQPEVEPSSYRGLTGEDVRSATAKLPAHLRTVLLLRHDRAASCQEIARDLRIPTATVCTRLHRARRHLHRLLSPQLEVGRKAG